MKEARTQKARSGLRVAPGCQQYWPTEWEVCGAIRDKWAQTGWEGGTLGYPTSDELSNGDIRFNRFQYGYIFWTATSGAFAVQNGSRTATPGGRRVLRCHVNLRVRP
ncbi:LGFP repeat-containing protein [Rhodococcus koreensis]|uniref:LGFP repeat-containing protein n=1 Tax=Rhodococcus koreensis TaxID=99653 RepID=UPI00366C3F01